MFVEELVVVVGLSLVMTFVVVFTSYDSSSGNEGRISVNCMG